MNMNNEQSSRVILLLHFLQYELTEEAEDRSFENLPESLLSKIDEDYIVFSFSKWKDSLSRVLGEKYFDSDFLKHKEFQPEYKESFFSDLGVISKYLNFKVFLGAQNEFIDDFYILDEDFSDAWIIIEEGELKGKAARMMLEFSHRWYKGDFVNRGNLAKFPKLLSPKQQISIICSEINDHFYDNQRDETIQQFNIFFSDSENYLRKDISFQSVLLYLHLERVITTYRILPNFKQKRFLMSKIDKHQLNKMTHLMEGNLQKKDKSGKTGVFNGIVFIKGISFGHVKSPEQEQRLTQILEMEESKPILNSLVMGDLSEDYIGKWVKRTNKSIFKGKNIIIKDIHRMYWQSED